jgi:uncharacterized protein YlaI
MPIIFFCPKCHREFRVRTASAGQKGRCTDCDTKVAIPDVSDVKGITLHPLSKSNAPNSNAEMENA